MVALPQVEQARPLLARPATIPAFELDDDHDEGDGAKTQPLNRPTASLSKTVTTTTTSEASASASEIDSSLKSLTRSTTIEELARTGKTKNLKTLSEKQLKEWIKEALRRVISSTTSIAGDEQERLLARTRDELSRVMSEPQIDHSAKLAEAELTISELRAQIANLTAEIIDATPPTDPEVLSSLRDVHHTQSEELTQVRRTLARRLTASSTTSAALIDLDRRYYAGAHHQGADDSATAAADPEAAFFADEAAAQATLAALARDLAALHQRINACVPDVAESAAGALSADLERLAMMEYSGVNDHLIEDLNAQLRHAKASVQGDQALRDRLADRESALAKAGSDVAKTAADFAESRAQAARLRLENERLGRELERAHADAARTGDHEADTAALAELRRRLDASTAAAAGAHSRTEQLEGTTARLRADNSAALAMLEDQRRQLDAARANGLGKAKDEAAVGDLRRQLEAVSAAATAAQARVAHAEIEAVRLRNEREAASAAQADLRKQSEEALAKAKAATTQAATAQAEAERLRAELQAQSKQLQTQTQNKQPTSAADPVWSRAVALATAPQPVRPAPVRSESLPADTRLAVHGLASGSLVAWLDPRGHGRLAAINRQGGLEASRDLGPARGAPSPVRGTTDQPFTVWTSAEGQVHLLDSEGAIHNLTHSQGLPPAAGPAAAWYWAQEGSRHISWRDAAGRIHELLDLDGTWRHADLSAQTGCPAAASDPVGYAPADHEHVIYRGTDGGVHELCFDGTRWLHHPVSAAAEAPNAAGRPDGAYLAEGHTLVYRDVAGAVHTLTHAADWRYAPLTALGAIVDDPRFSIGQDGTHANVVATGDDGMLRRGPLPV